MEISDGQFRTFRHLIEHLRILEKNYRYSNRIMKKLTIIIMTSTKLDLALATTTPDKIV